MFTSLGRYLYVPVHVIPETKWKDLGKHITNIIQIQPEEKIVASFVYSDKENNLIMFTKNGLVKRSVIKDFEVSRYTKAMTAIKLKEDDELVSVTKDLGKALCISQTGYYLVFDSSEIPVVGIKASGVKGINLKDDILISGISFDESDEYINIFTNHRTAKRIKIADLSIGSRAKKGSTLMKKVKTVDYKVLSAYKASAKDIICIKADSEIREEKNSELPIMDLASTGSNISKYDIDGSFVRTELESFLNKKKKETEVKESDDSIKEEQILENTNSDVQEFTIDDFIDDFKL